MKVIVDEFRCDAHGVCVDACPEVFALSDDDDKVRVLIAETDDESLRESLNRAAALCPKAAITIEG
jgi:ferredoxin